VEFNWVGSPSLPFLMIQAYLSLQSAIIFATADEADAYVLQMFFSVFIFFSVRHKNTRQPFSKRLNWFSWNFYQTIAGKM